MTLEAVRLQDGANILLKVNRPAFDPLTGRRVSPGVGETGGEQHQQRTVEVTHRKTHFPRAVHMEGKLYSFWHDVLLSSSKRGDPSDWNYDRFWVVGIGD